MKNSPSSRLDMDLHNSPEHIEHTITPSEDILSVLKEIGKNSHNEEIALLTESMERKILQLQEKGVEGLPTSLLEIIRSTQNNPENQIPLSNIVAVLTK